MTFNAELDEELAAIVNHFSLQDADEQPSNTENANGNSEPVADVTSNDAQPPPPASVVESPKPPESENGSSPIKIFKVEPKEESRQGMARSRGSDDHSSLERRVNTLSHEIARLLDRIYETQELRHMSGMPEASTASSSLAPASKIDTLLSSLAESTTRLRPKISKLESAASTYAGPRARSLQDGLEDLLRNWKMVEEQQQMLAEEMKEDGWLVRFRTTADQAEALIVPLQKSYTEFSHYVERLSNSTNHIHLTSEYDEQPSIQRLQKLAKGHESLTRTYVPSVTKILKMMDKSISERPVKNGEALRRFGEMTQRWATLQKQLNHLDNRVRSIISRHVQSGYMDGEGGMELLAEMSSPYGSPDSRGDYFGYGTAKSRESTFGSSSRPTPSHRSSISSGVSTSSVQSSARQGDVPPPIPPKDHTSSTLSPKTAMRPLQLRKRTSMISTASSNTTTRSPVERPRWNSSPKVSEPSPAQTPTTQRRGGALPRAVSPTPSNTSITSTASRRLSRLPVSSPFGKGISSPGAGAKLDPSAQGEEEVLIPGLTVSNSHSRRLLAEPSSMNRGSSQSQHHLERARIGLKTPEPARPRLSSTFSAFSPASSNAGTPSIGPRTYSTGTTSRSATGGNRQPLNRGPPSAFRVTSPTPSGTTGTRPSSRLSMMSYQNFNPNTLEPFVASKYDQLDQEVQRIISEVDFNLFVARVDQAMKRGQRRRDDEEWKGEYVFGRGEKPASVKLLKIAGQRPGMEKRVKCLVRVGGAWHDLASVLKKRMDEMESF